MTTNVRLAQAAENNVVLEYALTQIRFTLGWRGANQHDL